MTSGNYHLNTICLILGGGRGSRLYPLTKDRAKPAVPLLGQYRLIDIPISNCLNSGMENIYVLTQFNSNSLLRHIANTYKFDTFSEGWVQILPAQQTLRDSNWYQGTADAVRQNLPFIKGQSAEYTLILSGDQLYRMDFNDILQTHVNSQADATVCCTPVEESLAGALGIIRTNPEGTVEAFLEKPGSDALPAEFEFGTEKPSHTPSRSYLASMGIYVFNTDILVDALESLNTCHDFGSEVLPGCVERYKLHSHIFSGYWQDVGTVKNFYTANLSFVSGSPGFKLYEEKAPVYTHPRFLPLPIIENCQIRRSIIGSGSEINGLSIENSVIGLRTRIGRNVKISESIIMGADFMPGKPGTENDDPPVGIGPDCILKNCIIDKNARIGSGVKIWVKPSRACEDTDIYSIRDGIVIIPKNTVLKDGTVI